MVAGVMCRVIGRGCSTYAQEGGRYRNAGGCWYVGIGVRTPHGWARCERAGKVVDDGRKLWGDSAAEVREVSLSGTGGGGQRERAEGVEDGGCG